MLFFISDSPKELADPMSYIFVLAVTFLFIYVWLLLSRSTNKGTEVQTSFLIPEVKLSLSGGLLVMSFLFLSYLGGLGVLLIPYLGWLAIRKNRTLRIFPGLELRSPLLITLLGAPLIVILFNMALGLGLLGYWGSLGFFVILKLMVALLLILVITLILGLT